MNPAIDSPPIANRFDDFFVDPVYLKFKKYFWNYRLRRSTIQHELKQLDFDSILEVGCGVAPMVSETAPVVYTDLSAEAIDYLHQKFPNREGFATSAASMPFTDGKFACVVSSEVLEHIPDDISVFKEVFRVLKPGGIFILTVPSHQYFFSFDDHFVHHKRRYDPVQLEGTLRKQGFANMRIQKVAGILDKAALMAAVLIFKVFSPDASKAEKAQTRKRHTFLLMLFPLYAILNFIYGILVWIEARLIPMRLATIIMVSAEKPR